MAKRKIIPSGLASMLCFVLVVVSQQGRAQVLVEDLTPRLQAYDYSEGWFEPYTQASIVGLEVDLDKYSGYSLQITGPAESQVLSGEARIQVISKEGKWVVPLPELGKGKVWLTLVASESSDRPWHIEVINPTVTLAEEDAFPLRQGDQRRYSQNTLVLLWFVMAFLFLLAKNGLPRIFLEYFSYQGVFASVQREEAAYKASLLDRSNLLFVVLYSLGISTLLLLISFHNPSFGELYFQVGDAYATLGHIINWLLWGIAIMLLLGAKWMAVLLLGTPFNMGAMRKLQMYNYLRAGIFFLIPGSLLFLTLQIAMGGRLPGIEWVLGSLLVGTFGVRILILYLKLRRVSSHRNVHLISYLCATEIAPAAILVKLFYSI